MFVRGHMTRDPVCMGPDVSVRDVVKVMALHKIRHVPIVDADKRVIGIISDHELRAAADRLAERYDDVRAHEIMSRSPRMIESCASFRSVLAHFCGGGDDALLVLECGALAGILTRADFLRAISNGLALEAEGSSVEVALSCDADLATAFEVLHAHGVKIRSAVAGRIRDDGDEAVLFLRIGDRNSRPVERALAEAALTLLVPEEEMLTSDGMIAAWENKP